MNKSINQCCAQLLIVTVYMLYGIFVYSFQGQFTLGLAFQGVSVFSWQTVGNTIGLVTGIIAAGLYGNIGISMFAALSGRIVTNDMFLFVQRLPIITLSSSG